MSKKIRFKFITWPLIVIVAILFFMLYKLIYEYKIHLILKINNYMDYFMELNRKLKLIKKDFLNPFFIKTGKVIEIDNKCFQVPKWISTIFYIYYSGVIFISFFILFTIVDIYIKNLFLSFIASLILYYIIEVIIFLFIPLKDKPCYKRYK